jgi:beta-lactamase superfamily II metal-dependent hydrolase
MLQISCKFFSAGCADAISISFKDITGKSLHIFIDSGTEAAYYLLRPELLAIADRGEEIGLWVISHWDNDHIFGIIKVLQDNDIRSRLHIKQVWFNANYRVPRNPGATSGWTGLKEGALLRDMLQDELGIPAPIITSENPIIELLGLKFTILSPSLDVYQEAMAKMQTHFPLAAKRWDHGQTIEALARQTTPLDRSLANRSSIAFLLEAKGYRMLMLADASPVDLVEQLQQLGYSPTNRLQVNLVKVSHHGSKRNISRALLAIIETSQFVFTADALERHKLPDKEAIAHILCHSQRDFTKHIKLFFNHRTSKLERIFDVDGQDVFDRLNFSVHFPTPEDNALIIYTNEHID